MAQRRGGSTFDPYAILRELEDARVAFILIGSLARVLQGSDEVARGLDLTPSTRPTNLERLDLALERLEATPARHRAAAVSDIDGTLRTFASPPGQIRIVSEPIGTRGYGDLRRKANRVHLGEGLRPQVAAPGDLVRMLEAVARPEQMRVAVTMRRVVELDRSLGLDR